MEQFSEVLHFQVWRHTACGTAHSPLPALSVAHGPFPACLRGVSFQPLPGMFAPHGLVWAFVDVYWSHVIMIIQEWMSGGPQLTETDHMWTIQYFGAVLMDLSFNWQTLPNS